MNTHTLPLIYCWLARSFCAAVNYGTYLVLPFPCNWLFTCCQLWLYGLRCPAGHDEVWDELWFWPLSENWQMIGGEWISARLRSKIEARYSACIIRHWIDRFFFVFFFVILSSESCPNNSRCSAAAVATTVFNWSSSFTASPRRPSEAAGTSAGRGRQNQKGVGREGSRSSTRQRQISHGARACAEGSGKLPGAIRGRTERKFQAPSVIWSCC